MDRVKFRYRPARTRLQKLFKFSVTALAGLASLYAILYLTISICAYYKEKEVDKKWSSISTDLSMLPAYYPERKKNDVATSLQAMVAINNNSFELKGEPRYWEWQEIAGWRMEDELSKNTDEIRLPEEAKSYLVNHEVNYEILYKHLKRGIPEWGFEQERIFNEPVTMEMVEKLGYPDLLQIRAILNLIILDILNKTAEGKDKEAAEALEAAWRLRESVINRPDLIGQLISVVIDGSLSRLIPKMKNLPSEWQERIIKHNYHSSMLNSFLMEYQTSKALTAKLPNLFKYNRSLTTITTYYHYEKSEETSKWKEILEVLGTSLARPYFQLCNYDFLEKSYEELVPFIKKDVCNLDSYDYEMTTGVSGWNLINRHTPRGFKASWRTVHIAGVRLETVRMLLYIKENYRTREESRFKLDSTLCQNGEWLGRVSKKGLITVTYNKRINGLNEEEKILAGYPKEWQLKF